MIVNVFDLVGKNCITLDQGKKVYNEIYPLLKSGEKVKLDFRGTERYAAPFFNLAIGRLLKYFSSKELGENLNYLTVDAPGVTSFVISAINLVIKNSEKYYNDSEHKKAVDSAMARISEEGL